MSSAKTRFIHILTTFLLVSFNNVLALPVHAQYQSGVVPPTPLPTQSLSTTTSSCISSIKNNTLLSEAEKNYEIEACVSFEDPQRGYPYHPCKVIVDPISKIFVETFDAAKNTFVNSSGITGLLTKNVFEGLTTSAKALSNTILNRIPSQILSAIPNPDLRSTDYGMQYHFGCDTGNICAQSRKIQLPDPENPDGPLITVTGGNVCIPEESWGAYTAALVEDKLAADSQSNGEIRAMSTGKPSGIAWLMRSQSSPQSAFAGLCFRSSPRGQDILKTILAIKNPKQYGLSQALIAVPLPITALPGYTMEQNLTYHFYNDPGSAQWLLSQKKQIVDRINDYAISQLIIGFEDTVTKTQIMADKEKYFYNAITEDEVNEVGKCLQAAQKNEIYTAIGNFPVNDMGKFLSSVIFGILFSFAGAITLGCAIYSAIRIQLSQGGEGMSKARETLMHCLSGLALIIFAVFMLRFVGWDILRLPGLG